MDRILVRRLTSQVSVVYDDGSVDGAGWLDLESVKFSDGTTPTYHLCGLSTTSTPPQASNGTVTTDENTPTTVDLTTLVSDADKPASQLTYNILDVSGGMLAPTANNGVYTFTPTPNFSGTASITYNAADGDSPDLTSDLATVTITVNPINHAPTALPGGPYTVEYGQPILLDGTAASDPDGDALSYTWDFGDGSPTYTESPDSTPDGQYDGRVYHTYNFPGFYTVTLAVSDDQGLASSASTSVQVTDHTLPVIEGVPTEQPNANGWYNHEVKIHFTALGGPGGLAYVSPDQTISTEGADQSVTGTAMNFYGAVASVTVSGINIDKTPTVTSSTLSGSPAPNGWYTGAVSVSLSATDNLSGVAATYYRIGRAEDTRSTIPPINRRSRPAVSRPSTSTASIRPVTSKPPRAVSSGLHRMFPARSAGQPRGWCTIGPPGCTAAPSR